MPKVSVIIPVYNTEKYLRRCLDSVCNQTLQDIELICINDCSPDNSLDILQEYANKDKRIKIINFTENKGVSMARNSGINASNGEYIGFVDPDDYVDLDFFEKLYLKSIESGIRPDAVKAKINRCSGNNVIRNNISFESNHNDVKDSFYNFCNNFTSAIYNSKFIKDNNIYFPENTRRSEDIYFLIKATFFYDCVVTIDDTYYHYADNDNSATKNYTEASVKSSVNSMLHLLNQLNDINIEPNRYVVCYASIIRNINVFNNKEEVSESLKEYVASSLVKASSICKHKDAYDIYLLNRDRFNEEKGKKNILAILRKNIKK